MGASALCIAIASTQPLTIKCIMECLRPMRWHEHGVLMDQTFDVLLRNDGDADVDTLTILHPRQLPADDADPRVIATAPLLLGNSVYDYPPERDKATGKTKLTIRSRALNPWASQTYSHDTDLYATTVIQGARVHPAYGGHERCAKLQKFDRDCATFIEAKIDRVPPGQTHFIRMGVPNVLVQQDSAESYRIDPALPARMIKSIGTISPDLVYKSSTDWLTQLASNRGVDQDLSATASSLLNKVVATRFYRTSTPVRVEDHRIAIVNGPSIRVVGWHADRAIRFWQNCTARIRAPSGVTSHTATVFGAGPAWRPDNDPEVLAWRIRQFMNDLSVPRRKCTIERLALGIRAELAVVVLVVRLLDECNYVRFNPKKGVVTVRRELDRLRDDPLPFRKALADTESTRYLSAFELVVELEGSQH